MALAAGVFGITVLIGGLFFATRPQGQSASVASAQPPIAIGIVTALTGDFAFYGESTRAGVKLAEIDLQKEGLSVQFVFEDAETSAEKAVSAAQKLINLDRVRGIYSEFNPPAIAISSLIKGSDILHVYDAAPISPLKDNPLVYKSYIDYVEGCRETARYLKNSGVTSIGVLRANVEFGELCEEGVKQVFGAGTVVEPYNLGTTDFRSALLKLSKARVGAIINASFPTEVMSALKQMRELDIAIPYATESDSISDDAIAREASFLEGVVAFGLPPASEAFVSRLHSELPRENAGFPPAAALGYIHAKHMAHALLACKEATCIRSSMDRSPAESVIAFQGFKDHVAQFSMPIQVFRGGAFVEVGR